MATGSFLCEPVAAMCIEPPATPEMGWFEKEKRVIPKTVLRLRMSMRN